MSLPCWGVSSQLLSMLRYWAIRCHPKNKEWSCWIVAAGECFLIMIHVINKESKKQPLWIYLLVKLADGKMLIKKWKSSPQIFTYSKPTIEILKKNCSKLTIRTPGRLSTFYWLWKSNCLLRFRVVVPKKTFFFLVHYCV